MDKEQLQLAAFEIIGYAGDAFDKFYSAVEVARKGDFDTAEALLAEGETIINKAHTAQTDLLVEESRENAMEFSLIVVHSQDHLMTTIMYERIAKQIIEVLKDMAAKG